MTSFLISFCLPQCKVQIFTLIQIHFLHSGDLGRSCLGWGPKWEGERDQYQQDCCFTEGCGVSSDWIHCLWGGQRLLVQDIKAKRPTQTFNKACSTATFLPAILRNEWQIQPLIIQNLVRVGGCCEGPRGERLVTGYCLQNWAGQNWSIQEGSKSWRPEGEVPDMRVIMEGMHTAFLYNTLHIVYLTAGTLRDQCEHKALQGLSAIISAHNVFFHHMDSAMALWCVSAPIGWRQQIADSPSDWFW